MDEKLIKILWIDDELVNYNAFSRRAERKFGLRLDSFKSKEEGLNAYAKDPESYKGVILDGCILENKDSAPNTADSNHSLNVIYKLIEYDKSLKICVLTGNPNDAIEKNYKATVNNVLNDVIYEKGRDDNKVLEIIKEAATNRIEYKFKSIYPNIYKLYELNAIDDNSLNILFGFSEFVNDRNQQTIFLNEIRIIIENLFKYLCTIKFLPDHIVPNTDSWFARGITELKYISTNDKKEFITPIIIDLLTNLREYSSDASHYSGGTKLGVATYIKESKTGFLSTSLVYMLFDVLDYFGCIIDELINSDNKWVYQNFERIRVTVDKISDNGFVTCISNSKDTFQITIPPKISKTYDLKEGQTLLLEVSYNRKQNKYYTKVF